MSPDRALTVAAQLTASHVAGDVAAFDRGVSELDAAGATAVLVAAVAVMAQATAATMLARVQLDA
jgi:hypothetical protein